MSDRMERLRDDLGNDLDRIRRRFKGEPNVTLVVRNTSFGDADIVMTSEADVQEAIKAITRFAKEEDAARLV